MADRAGRAGDAGDASVAAVVGFALILLVLLAVAQVAVRLYAQSALTSAATRAAETVSESSSPLQAEAAAGAALRSQLGPFGASHVRLSWDEADGAQVVLRVEAGAPSLLPGPASWRTITRSVTVRTERFR